MVLNYKKFILKEAKKVEHEFIMSDELINILSNINDSVSKQLLNMIGNNYEISYIDITDKKDYISFIQSSNIKKILDNEISPWEATSRQELRVGKFINKVLNVDKTYVERFVNSYKSSFDFDKYVDSFDIVDGDDMAKYYCRDNQINKGHLYNSCMGGEGENVYIKEFYATNSEKVKMLILRDSDNPHYIIGRANLWYLDEPKGEIFMDRIYTTEDYLVNIFIEYAKKNNYIYKSRQIYGGNVIPIIKNGEEIRLIMNVNLNVKDYKYFPYVDTFQFFNRKTGEITNDTSKWELTKGDSDWIALIHAGGNYLTYDNDDGFKMDYLGRLVHPYFVVWSKMDNCYIHKNDAIRLRYLNDYCIPETDVVYKNGEYFLRKDI